MAAPILFAPATQQTPKAEGDDPRAQRLVEAAYELLDQDGLEGLTIRAVLARSGLARRAFYDNFTGKDDLVLAVFSRTIAMAAEYYHMRGAEISEPIDRLHMIITSIGLGGAAHDTVRQGDPTWDNLRTGTKRGAALSREHLRLAESHPQELQAALAPLLAEISAPLREGMAKGQFRNCDADLQAALIYNLVSTTVHSEYLAEELHETAPDRRAILARELWEFCRRAIAG